MLSANGVKMNAPSITTARCNDVQCVKAMRLVCIAIDRMHIFEMVNLVAKKE